MSATRTHLKRRSGAESPDKIWATTAPLIMEHFKLVKENATQTAPDLYAQTRRFMSGAGFAHNSANGSWRIIQVLSITRTLTADLNHLWSGEAKVALGQVSTEMR
jgi:hypothetical protein